MRRRHAHAQERQRRLGDDGLAHLEGGQHQHRAQHVGQHVAAQQPGARHADEARGLHVLLVALHQCRAAHRARVAHPVGDRHREDQHRERQHVVGLREHEAPHPVDQQRDQDRRERQHHVAQAHRQPVDDAAREPGHQAGGDAHQHGQRPRAQGHHQRDAGAVEQRREDVAALVVGAQRIGGAAVGEPRRRQIRVGQRAPAGRRPA